LSKLFLFLRYKTTVVGTNQIKSITSCSASDDKLVRNKWSGRECRACRKYNRSRELKLRLLRKTDGRRNLMKISRPLYFILAISLLTLTESQALANILYKYIFSIFCFPDLSADILLSLQN